MAVLSGQNNTDNQIMAGVAHLGRDMRFWDARQGYVFNASPCECCGRMSADANPLRLVHISDRVSRALASVFETGVVYNECTDYTADGRLMCEMCEAEFAEDV